MEMSRKIRDPGSLVEKVIDKVRQALISGELKAGQRLPPIESMAQQFGISRTAIREALNMLVALGVAKMKVGDGTYITKQFSSQAIDPLTFSLILCSKTTSELWELRKMVELGMLNIVIKKATQKDIRKMQQAISGFDGLRKNKEPDLEKLYRSELDFHFAFAKAAHNPSIERIAGTIWKIFGSSIKKSVERASNSRHHKRILEALIQKDLEEGRRAIIASLDAWEKTRLQNHSWAILHDK